MTSASSRIDLAELREALRDRLEQLVETLPLEGRTLVRGRRQWRWGTHGSLALEVSRPKRGAWYSHESSKGGGPLGLIVYARGCTFGEAVQWGAAFAGITPSAPKERAAWQVEREQRRREREQREAEAENDLRSRIEAARCVWCASVDPTGTIVETYLQHRGVALPDEPVIRFHARCPRGHNGAPLPAMVALMTDPVTGKPCGIHRTYLERDGRGKAAIDGPRRMLGAAGVIRLADPSAEGLGLAEGIETALSCMQTIGWGPVWAAGSASAISAFPVLPGHSLSIFADNDDGGVSVTAGRTCAARWNAAGRECLIHIAPAGRDWNDAARLQQRLEA